MSNLETYTCEFHCPRCGARWKADLRMTQHQRTRTPESDAETRYYRNKHKRKRTCGKCRRTPLQDSPETQQLSDALDERWRKSRQHDLKRGRRLLPL